MNMYYMHVQYLDFNCAVELGYRNQPCADAEDDIKSACKELFSSLFTPACYKGRKCIFQRLLSVTSMMFEHFFFQPCPCPVLAFCVSAELITLYSVSCQ
jgi:hypothetical protein